MELLPASFSIKMFWRCSTSKKLERQYSPLEQKPEDLHEHRLTTSQILPAWRCSTSKKLERQYSPLEEKPADQSNLRFSGLDWSVSFFSNHGPNFFSKFNCSTFFSNEA